jgi:hypothetical protein
MKHHRLAAPVLALALGMAAVLAMAGTAFACSPPGITIGTCAASGGTNVRNWILTPEDPYYKVLVSIHADYSDPVSLTLVSGPNTYQTPANVDTLYVQLDPAANYGGDETWHSKDWAGSLCTPTLSTTPSAGGVVGTAIYDSATVGGLGGSSPAGSITFKLYGPYAGPTTECSGDFQTLTPASTVTGDGVYQSPNVTPTVAGTYEWIASYSGDTNNNPISTSCGEPVVITKATPGLVTTPSAGGVPGTAISDSATLSGGYGTLTGSITFSLYGPYAAGVTPTCSGGAIQTWGPMTVSGYGPYTTSPSFTDTTIGTYEWVVSYSGDPNNAAVSSNCGDEPVVISVIPHILVSPTITTQLSELSGLVGDSVSDLASLHGATPNAGGHVTYTVYTDSACTLGAQSAGTVLVTNGSVPRSNSITFGSVGTWYWQAVYSGDANNRGATSLCTSETLVISTPSATQSLEGATATPAPTSVVKGVTAPPTSTGSTGSGEGSTPLFALLICLAFGGLGVLAVEAQRRSMRV